MRYAFLLLVPLVALGGLDYTELTITSVTNTQEATASSVLPVYGEVRAVYIEITPTAGTWTNTVTVSTTADKGVSFADQTIFSAALKGTTNYVYYPLTDAHDAAGALNDMGGGLLTNQVPFLLLGDTLKLYTTNFSSASTNAIKVRVITEN